MGPILCYTLATSLLRKTEFRMFLEISTSFALLWVQSAKGNPPWHLQDYITSARVTPTPVFSENIVVPIRPITHTYICNTHPKPKLGHCDPSPGAKWHWKKTNKQTNKSCQ